MEIRNGVDGLKTLLGVTSSAPARERTVQDGQAAPKVLTGDQATLSSAGTEVSHAGAEPGVRADKVAAVKAGLAAGTYSVPASAVAGKLVDAMLGNEIAGH